MTKHNHKILFILVYVAMPAILAWVGYQLSHDKINVGHKIPAFGQNADGNYSKYRTQPGSDFAFYDLPSVALSMSSVSGDTGTMKLDLSLEVPQDEVQRVNDFEPRIVEKIVFFMRDQSFEKFQKPNGARDLRRDLENAIRNGAFPIRIASVNVRRMVFE